MRQKQPQLPEKNKTKPVEDQGGFFSSLESHNRVCWLC
jgi:hypothetical protein